MAAQLFGIAVAIIIAGWLWFYIARPILEDFGVIRPVEDVNTFEDAAPPQAPVRSSSTGGSRRVEPPIVADTSQLEPAAPVVLEPPTEPILIAHNMSRKELTILLAVQKDSEGAYRFSANKIAEFVGGTAAEVKGWVADVRGRREPAASRLTRPAGGW